MGDVQSRCWTFESSVSSVERQLGMHVTDELSLDAPPRKQAGALGKIQEQAKYAFLHEAVVCHWRQEPAYTSDGHPAASQLLHPCAIDILECHMGITLEIAAYAVSTPWEMLQLSCLSASMPSVVRLEANRLWMQIFRTRWPAFYENLRWHGEHRWRRLYRNMMTGVCECLLEIYHRGKKLGFTMSAMPAQVRYDPQTNSYIAKYLSISDVPPEHIPIEEEHRLRFCPSSARERLQPGLMSPVPFGPGCVHTEDIPAEQYPYRVLEGLEGLTAGMDVELQWKMQAGSPFGLWFGHLESLSRTDGSAKEALATITFRHFPTHSSWYRLKVIVGGPEIRPCAFGGFTGGLRPVQDSERKVWMKFFPGWATSALPEVDIEARARAHHEAHQHARHHSRQQMQRELQERRLQAASLISVPSASAEPRSPRSPTQYVRHLLNCQRLPSFSSRR
eukprot:gb/GFBE01047861.1/.p1 GENE.gb/GFBE01047861.1/~~gb/GFBE01047861.1/.p1  ORF type:complete len:448 (+),score=48.88 gb/GFBE01047861.1/:1-1344(+)